MKQIEVYVMFPGEYPYKTRIDNTLEAFQEIVDGYIEAVTFPAGLVVICNEEGRLKELEPTCTVCGVDFCGPVIFAGADGDEFADCPLRIDLMVVKEDS